MAVLDLVSYRCKETVAVLRLLVEMAQAGRLRGVALSVRTDSGEEHTYFTGVYRSHPGDAVAAAMRVSWSMTQDHDGAGGP